MSITINNVDDLAATLTCLANSLDSIIKAAACSQDTLLKLVNMLNADVCGEITPLDMSAQYGNCNPVELLNFWKENEGNIDDECCRVFDRCSHSLEYYGHIQGGIKLVEQSVHDSEDLDANKLLNTLLCKWDRCPGKSLFEPLVSENTKTLGQLLELFTLLIKQSVVGTLSITFAYLYVNAYLMLHNHGVLYFDLDEKYGVADLSDINFVKKHLVTEF